MAVSRMWLCDAPALLLCAMYVGYEHVIELLLDHKHPYKRTQASTQP